MISTPVQGIAEKEWWQEDAGFFGRRYMEGDDSQEGYLTDPQTLEERTATEVAGIIRLLNLEAGQRVLDCPCGYGRHSIGLARSGMDVVGADINSEELAFANQKAEQLTNIRFVKQDMRCLSFESQFDAVINMFYSFGFFETDEQNFQVLSGFYRALKPNGLFLMHTDVHLPRVLAGKYKFRENRNLRTGNRLEIIDAYNPFTKRIEGSWTLFQGNSIYEELTPYSVRVFSYEEFADWCYQAGFREVYGYGDWQATALTDDSEDMMVV